MMLQSSTDLTQWPKVPIPLSHLVSLYNDRSTSDFTIILPRSEREIYAHKLILAAASGFFRGLFHSGMSDSSDSSYTFQVEDHLHELDPVRAERAFGYVIQMLYTANFSCIRGDDEEEDNVQEIKMIFQMLSISIFLQIKDLISACSFILSRAISETNCCYYLMMPPTEEMFELKKKAMEFFSDNKRLVLFDTNVSQLSYEILVGVLVSKPMKLKEEEITIMFDFWKEGDVVSREPLRKQFMGDIKAKSIENLSWYGSKVKEEPYGVFEVLKTAKKEFKTMFIGLDAGGKTSILYRLKLSEFITTIPTIGFNVETIEHNNHNITIWDVGGGDRIHTLWRHYFDDARAIIVVVDSSDQERMGELKEVIDTSILANDGFANVPVLFFANKQDLPQALPVFQVCDRLGLYSIKGRPWFIQACCAATGDGLYEGFDWLISNF